MTWRRNPIISLDLWWETKTDFLRLDHNVANLCMLVGLICSSFSILALGPSPSSALVDMTDGLQMWMCGCIFIGCLIKFHGVLCRSRFWFRHMPLRRCYQLGYTGAPIASSGLFVYGYYILEHTQTWTSALGGVLTPLLGIGISGQGIVYWLEARRIERVEHAMIRVAQQIRGHGGAL